MAQLTSEHADAVGKAWEESKNEILLKIIDMNRSSIAENIFKDSMIKGMHIALDLIEQKDKRTKALKNLLIKELKNFRIVKKTGIPRITCIQKKKR